MPRVVPPRGGSISSDELVGRSPTVFTTLGTLSSSPTPKPSNRGRRKQDGNVRTVRLRLLPSGAQEGRLRKLADAAARLWNELNYARLVQWRESRHVDFKGTEHEYYHKYNSVLGVNAGQVINLNNGAWM